MKRSSGNELHVLLMAPLEGRDAPSGDITYTDVLLREPPPGVRYTTYADALEAGTMTIRGRRPGHGSLSAVDAGLLLLRGLEKAARGRFMFREPYWYVSIRPGEFDLLHQHLFTVRQVGPRVPAVSSAGFPLSVLYQAREGWSRWRTARAESLERSYARLVRAHTPGLWAPPDDVLTVYTEYYRQQLLASGPQDKQIVLVSRQALPELTAPAHQSAGKVLGFIGRDFHRKGGDIAIEAFRVLRSADPDLTLIIVTRAGVVDERLLPDGVTLVTEVPRSTVIHELLPRIDVLLLPTSADCGAPYGVIEALQMRIPIVTSQLSWLDERLEPPAVYRVARTAPAVAATVESLLEPQALAQARSAAHDLWRRSFSMDVLHSDLERAYSAALTKEGNA
jgi:glycosyltransferase involved in cell wall biosynthesis